MAIRKRKFLRLLPGRIHKFKLRASSNSGISAWTDVLPIRTSGILDISWTAGNISAKPKFWLRHIRVSWAPILQPLRLDHYLLFRYDSDLYGAAGVTAAITASGEAIDDGTYESNIHFLKDTGRLSLYIDKVQEGEDVSAADDNNAIIERLYYYWVWAIDRNGDKSSNYLGPDTAKFGTPDTPIIISPDNTESTKYTDYGIAADDDNFFKTEVKDINKWWCNVRIAWSCPSTAEHYWVRYRKKATPHIWSLPIYFEHDEKIEPWYNVPPYSIDGVQLMTIPNLQTDVEYDFQVKAVNVPGILVSDWSDIEWYLTEKDPYPPPEVQNVSAKRMRQLGIRKGEHIKLTWDRPTLAIMREQIDHYRIYKLKGTDAEALAVTTAINSATENAAEAWVIKEDKDEVPTFLKVLTTFFIDEDITEIVNAGVSWDFAWTCEGDNDTERATATLSGGELVGTLSGTYLFDTVDPYDGTYSFSYNVTGGSISFATGGGITFTGDEGFFEFYIKGDYTNPVGLSYIAQWYYSPFTRMQLYWNHPTTGIKLWRRQGAIHEADIPLAEFTGDNDPSSGWVRIQCRWNVDANFMSIRVGENDWNEADTSTPMEPFASPPDYLAIAGRTADGSHIDNVSLSLSSEVSAASSYYHYWVTAVDVDEKESVASQSGVTIVKADYPEIDGTAGTGESYDKVSFDKPAAPVLVTPKLDSHPGINQISVFGFPRYTIKFVWQDVDEATYFRVKVRFTPQDKTASAWHLSGRIDQARVNRDSLAPYNPFWIYPLSLQYNTLVEWTVIAGNMAGESEATIESFTILGDTTPPTKVSWVRGDCKGISPLFADQQNWMAATLVWTALKNSEGVDIYEVYADGKNPGNLVDTFKHVFAAGIIPSNMKRTVWFPESGPSHTYYIRAVDNTNVPGEWSDPLVVNYEVWWQF